MSEEPFLLLFWLYVWDVVVPSSFFFFFVVKMYSTTNNFLHLYLWVCRCCCVWLVYCRNNKDFVWWWYVIVLKLPRWPSFCILLTFSDLKTDGTVNFLVTNDLHIYHSGARQYELVVPIFWRGFIIFFARQKNKTDDRTKAKQTKAHQRKKQGTGSSKTHKAQKNQPTHQTNEPNSPSIVTHYIITFIHTVYLS